MDFKKITKPYQDELMKSIDRFVAIPSVYDAKSVSKSKPYGKYIDEVLSEFAKFGKKNGFKIERNPRYVELSYGSKGPIIGVYGHLDVVPAINSKIFKVRREKDKIFGRGVIDDKGPLLSATYAAIALKNLGLIKNVQLKIFAGGDEERGSSCLASYAKTHQAPKYGFTPDSDFPVVYGEKGLTSIVISKNIKFKNIISIKGGVVSNAVIGEATFKVNNINEIKNKLKFPHKIKGNEITYLGASAHASTPQNGKNAFLLGLKELAKLNHDTNALKLADAFLDHTGRKLGIYNKSKYLGETTVCVGIVKYKDNKLTMSVDCRRPENAKHKVLVNKIIKSFGFNLVKANYHDPLLFNPKSPLVSLLMDAYKKETGDLKSKPCYSGGGTYAKEIGNTVAFGPESHGVDWHLHEDGEFIYIKHLYLLLQVYAHAIYNFVNAKK